MFKLFISLKSQNMLKLCLSTNIQKGKFRVLIHTWGRKELEEGFKMKKKKKKICTF